MLPRQLVAAAVLDAPSAHEDGFVVGMAQLRRRTYEPC